MESMPALQNDMQQKALTDWRTSFWTDFLLVLVTFGIYGVFIFYKLLERRQQHFERMVPLRWDIIRSIRERATMSGRIAEVEQGLSELEGLHARATGRDRAGDKSPVVWLVLAILGFFPATYYAMNFLNHDFHDHETNEMLFLSKAGDLMAQLGMGRQIMAVRTVPERSFLGFFLLTIITFGIYGVYWWYTLVNDPDKHFEGHGAWEGELSAGLVSGTAV